MKKLVLIIAMVLAFTSLSNAQWETRSYVDDFGDPTGSSYKALDADGVFSNSATKNSEAAYVFVDGGSSLAIYVLEYGKYPATASDHTFETIKIKTPSGAVIAYSDIFFNKQGRLYINDHYTALMETIKAPGNYIMIFNRTNNHNNKNYRIKFRIK